MNRHSFLYRLSPLVACLAFWIIPSEAGLISYWELDEASGPTVNATVGTDGTYENFAPTDFNRPGVPGTGGTSVSLTDGGSASTKNRINLGNSGGSLAGRSQFTVSMWANFDSVSGDDALLSIGNWSAGAPLLIWRDDSSALSGSTSTDTLAAAVEGNRVDGFNDVLDQTNNWYHIALTFEGGSADGLQLFVDGTNVTNGSETPLSGGTPATLASGTPPPLTAGQLSGTVDGSKQLNGRLDEIAFYSRVLSDDEILALAGGASPFSIVPEPSSALLSTLLLGLFSLRRRRRTVKGA